MSPILYTNLKKKKRLLVPDKKFKRFFFFYNIYGHGGHLGHDAIIVRINFLSPKALRLRKMASIGATSLEMFESVDDYKEPCYTISSPCR